MNWDLVRKLHLLSTEFKFNLCVIFCLCVHSLLIVFSAVYQVTALMIFNIFSVTVYTLCLFLVKGHQMLVYYFAYAEVVIHSFLSVVLLGNEFGFSLYFMLLVPMSYNMLHSVRVKKTFLKGTIAALSSFVCYVVCYYIARTSEPVYRSPRLEEVTPFVYVLNIVVTFVALVVFSLLFLLETEAAFKELNAKNKQLKTLANTDPLTGLYNRRTMSDHIKKMYRDYKDHKDQFSLVICDIDDFKHFNDTYGHDCGDVVLKSIANKLSALERDGDYLCRWGGEEFLALFSDIGIEKAREIAERFRSSIEELDVEYNDLHLNITMTFGVAGVTEAENYEHLFKIADQRLYEGKHAGKNCVR